MFDRTDRTSWEKFFLGKFPEEVSGKLFCLFHRFRWAGKLPVADSHPVFLGGTGISIVQEVFGCVKRNRSAHRKKTGHSL